VACRRNNGACRVFGDPCTSSIVREQLTGRGVYYDVFEESVLSEKKTRRPVAFLISISAELVVVSALIIIPLYYNDHLPGFEWKNVGLGLPLKPIRPVAAKPLRQASNGPAYHQRFALSSLPPRSDRPTSFTQVSIEAPPNAGDFNGPFGDSSRPPIDLGERVQSVPPPPPPKPDSTPAPTQHEPIRVGGGVQMAKLVKKFSRNILRSLEPPASQALCTWLGSSHAMEPSAICNLSAVIHC